LGARHNPRPAWIGWLAQRENDMAKLFWRYGAMAAGKTLALLGVAHNYERLGRSVLIYTAAIDDRYGEGVVGTRLGIQRPARTFTRDTVFAPEDIPADTACILFDEAQFLTRAQVLQLHRLAVLHGFPVICYGLRSDFMGQAFEGAAALATLADQIEELKTVCACGRKASFNIRVDAEGRRIQEGEQIHIGGDAQYIAACPHRFYTGRCKA
jgi:thymidine kinase